MSDNVNVTEGTGTQIAADDVAGVKHQRVKVTLGADGVSDGDVSASNPMPVTIVSGVELEFKNDSGNPLPVSASSLPLPTGASTAANQTTANSSLSSIDSKTPALGQALSASSVPVVLPASQISTLTPPAAITGFALDATLTNGSAKSIMKSGTKGATTPAELTSSNIDANTQALDVSVKGTPNVTVSSLPALPAGSNAIGSVSVSNFPSSQAVTGTVTVTQATGTNLHTTVDNFPSTQTVTQTTGSNLHTVVDSGSITISNASIAVTASSLPLPTGAATETTLSALDTKVPTGLTVTSTRLLVDGSGVTQPISGSVTANAGTGTMAISAVSLPLPTGAATESTLAAQTNSAATSTTGLKGHLIHGAVSTSAPTYTNATVNNISLTTAGAVRVDSSTTTQPISAASLPLPSGAATSANQTTANSSLSTIANNTGNIPNAGQTTMVNSMPVVIASNQSTVPVSLASVPTHAVTQSGTWNINNISGTVSLPTGASTETTLSAMSGKLPATLGAKTTANSMSVNIASDQTVPVSATSLPLPSGAATSANQTSGNASLVSIDSKLSGLSVVTKGETHTSFSPDPTNTSTFAYNNIALDARGRVETHSTVLTDEGSFLDHFIGASLDASWTTSGTITVSGSNATLASGTAAGTSYMSKLADYGPFYIESSFRLSQRINNQTIIFGIRDNVLSPTQKAEFQFRGTDNTQVTCVTWSSSDASDISSTTITLPKNLTTASTIEYAIELVNGSVSFLINDDVVVTYQDNYPSPYTIMNLFHMAINSATVTNTNLISRFVSLNNVNRVEVGSSFKGEALEVAPIELKDTGMQTFSATAINLTPAALATDIFTIAGNSSKVVKIRKVEIHATQTTSGSVNIVLLRRSSANSGGSSSTITAAVHDSDDVAASVATVRAYTANPTTGTLQANIRALKQLIPTTTSNFAQPAEILFGESLSLSKPIILRSSSEVFAVNLAGVTVVGGSFNISIEWTESLS